MIVSSQRHTALTLSSLLHKALRNTSHHHQVCFTPLSNIGLLHAALKYTAQHSQVSNGAAFNYAWHRLQVYCTPPHVYLKPLFSILHSALRCTSHHLTFKLFTSHHHQMTSYRHKVYFTPPLCSYNSHSPRIHFKPLSRMLHIGLKYASWRPQIFFTTPSYILHDASNSIHDALKYTPAIN